MRPFVVVGTRISRRRDKEDPCVAGCTDRVLERLRSRSRTPACADHTNIHAFFLSIDRVVYRFNCILCRTKTASAEELERHYLHRPVHTCDPFVVVALGTDNACTVSAMAVIIHWVADGCVRIESVFVIECSELIIDVLWKVLGTEP